MKDNEVKDDYSYWSENLHSSYLFYTMEVDKLNKLNKQLTQKLEKAIETMDEVKNMINPDRSWECFDEWEEYVYKGMNRLQQALKELE